MQGILLFLFYFRKVCWAFGKREIIVNAKKKHVVARLQRVAKIHIFFCLQKNGNGFFVAIFTVCYLTDCILVAYVFFFLLWCTLFL